MEELLIRPGTAADLPAIAALQASVPEAADWPVEDYLTYHLDLAVRGGVLAGFLVTRRLTDDEAEILNLAVAPSARRQGVASQLLAAAFARWPGDWFLEVREFNARAQACYEKVGFFIAGRRPNYYSVTNANSREGGIVMVRRKC
ncbi:MAG: GNAT family N-acetyltransferase [Bryobacteraceae bacterium]|nr:GNAT family N-acetyltransferase [Bryobacteraceae bacterium]